MIREFIIPEDAQPMQAKEYLRGEMGLSHRLMARMKRHWGSLRCNGKSIRFIDMVYPGDSLTMKEPKEQESHVIPNPDLIVPVVQETEDFVVFCKPWNMPTHPSRDHAVDTLGNAYGAMYPDLLFRPAYRLDKDTGGLCVVAKNAFAAKALHHQVEKEYTALVCGHLSFGGTVDAPIERDETSAVARMVRPDGKPAITHFQPLGYYGKYTLVRLWLETGRTHQIRVHMAHLGYPLAGDEIYGGDLSDFQHHMLYCGKIRFAEPQTGKEIVVHSDWTEWEENAYQFPMESI